MGRSFLVLGVGTLMGFGLATAQSALGQPASGSGQTYSSPQMQRELDYGSGKSQDTNIFNTANPIDLMNKLRKNSAMDEATNPSDAVDAALKGFDAPATPAPKAGSAQVKAP
ncbi:hypothetical protein [Cyanobium sp. WAJ14-Wanaka]|uniref:hypothetical protein n=1 Tax=Cyanobium sp. WAJ14-Wanaka TaxID=2823725 RepID=UPI0020CCB9A0|nr:hypothetical protein [Cyanobium sp. WAJ14-Wanaka]MCP9775019.1 hypothetical protein [Cyanobium sp. WAJ14-Wanaka]